MQTKSCKMLNSHFITLATNQKMLQQRETRTKLACVQPATPLTQWPEGYKQLRTVRLHKILLRQMSSHNNYDNLMPHCNDYNIL